MTRLPLALALLLAALPVAAQTTSADSPSADAGGQPPAVTTDEDFLRLATSANLLEIRSSELILEKTRSPDIRAFAEAMIADHRAAAEQMAQAAGTTPPAPDSPDIMLEPRHATLMAQLEAAEGSPDAAYIDLQRQAHEQAVALFTDYATNGQEGAVKDFAGATLPKLQEHLEKVQQLPAE
ncbi:MAG: membrane protein [Rhodobacter sp. CACIA14H1]|nr:MAG: membrane protein [Rhodobacter sp. CACIA14H1]